jgi:hypothetical protein
MYFKVNVVDVVVDVVDVVYRPEDRTTWQCWPSDWPSSKNTALTYGVK